MVETKQVKFLPVKLTEPEMLKQGQEIARLEIDLVNVEEDKKESTATFREQIDELRTQIRGIARVIRDGVEEREVEIVEQPDYERGILSVVRTDTGEVVHERNLTEEERQQPLPDSEPVSGETQSLPH